MVQRGCIRFVRLKILQISSLVQMFIGCLKFTIFHSIQHKFYTVLAVVVILTTPLSIKVYNHSLILFPIMPVFQTSILNAKSTIISFPELIDRTPTNHKKNSKIEIHVTFLILVGLRLKNTMYLLSCQYLLVGILIVSLFFFKIMTNLFLKYMQSTT